MQGQFFDIDRVEIFDPELELFMRLFLCQMPVETLLKVPFVPLSEFPAHEVQRLAKMLVHRSIEQSVVGEFFSCLSRHLVEQRPFSIHYFIVRQWKDELFGESV